MCGPFLLSYAASWTRPASVLFQTAGDHARACPAGCLLDGCGVRCLPVSGDAPRHALRPSSSWRRGSCPHAPCSSRRQGTTEPGDALMVGIPAARLCFWNFENRLRIIHFCYCCQNSEWRFVRLQWTNTDFFDKIISGAKMADL